MKDIAAELATRGIPHRVTEFSSELFTAQAVAAELGMAPAQVAKAMLLKIAGGEFRIAVVPGDCRVDIDALTALLGKRVSIVDRSQVAAVTGVPVGAITPLVALERPQIRVVIDERVMQEDAINISSGTLTRGITISPSALRELVGADVARIAHK